MKQQYFNDSNDDQWYEGNEKVLIGWCKKEEGGGEMEETNRQPIRWMSHKKTLSFFFCRETYAARVPHQNDFRVELK